MNKFRVAQQRQTQAETGTADAEWSLFFQFLTLCAAVALCI